MRSSIKIFALTLIFIAKVTLLFSGNAIISDNDHQTSFHSSQDQAHMNVDYAVYTETDAKQECDDNDDESMDSDLPSEILSSLHSEACLSSNTLFNQMTVSGHLFLLFRNIRL